MKVDGERNCCNLVILQALINEVGLLFSVQCSRSNCRAIAMMSVRQSAHLSRMGMHCDHMVHFSVDLSLRLDSPMSWAP